MSEKTSVDPDDKHYSDQLYYKRHVAIGVIAVSLLLFGYMFYSVHFSSASDEETQTAARKDAYEQKVALQAQQESRKADPGGDWERAKERTAADYRIAEEDTDKVKGTAYGEGADTVAQDAPRRNPRSEVNASAKQQEEASAQPPEGMRTPYAEAYASRGGAGFGQQQNEQRFSSGSSRKERLAQLEEAMNASPVVRGGTGGGARSAPSQRSAAGGPRGPMPPRSLSVPSPQERQKQAMETFKQTLASLQQAQGGGQSGGGGYPSGPAPETGQSQFQVRAQEKADKGTYIATAINDPISEFEIKAGTVVPVVLMTDINTDLPGSIRAQVTRPVFDHQQRHLLIPRGTQLLGSYSSMIATGQSRALMAWERLIFPDGRSVQLPGLAGKDLGGATGVRDQVDRHLMRTLGMSVLLAGIGTGFQLASPRSSGSFSREPTSKEVFSQQIAMELSRVASKKISQQINIKPTLRVRRGMRLYVYFNRDLAFRQPYRDQREDFVRFHRPLERLGRQRYVRRAAPLDPGPYHVNPHSNRGQLFSPPRPTQSMGPESRNQTTRGLPARGLPARRPQSSTRQPPVQQSPASPNGQGRAIQNGATIQVTPRATEKSRAAEAASQAEAEQKEKDKEETITVD